MKFMISAGPERDQGYLPEKASLLDPVSQPHWSLQAILDPDHSLTLRAKETQHLTHRISTMDATERLQAASKFLLQAPPGEINDVLNGEPTSFLDCNARREDLTRYYQQMFGTSYRMMTLSKRVCCQRCENTTSRNS